MSADIRLWTASQYMSWFKSAVEEVYQRYLRNEIDRSEWQQWHYDHADMNTAYIRTRINLYARGYIKEPPY